MFGILWQATVAAGTQPVDTTRLTHGVAAEVVVKNPVPGFVGRIFQLLFNMPQWIQWGAIVLGALVGLALVMVLITKRQRIFDWMASRSRGYQVALAGVAAVLLIGAGGVGYAGNHYMQHNNDFCVGCHVMGDAWGAFQRSEHRKLQCHSCHRQSMFASAKQLYFWVAERPQEIPKHAKVPTNVCSECHVQSPSDSAWKRISATAGHRLHLTSDSSALKNVQCVTCHGQEVHRFKPVDKTCGQTGCHAAKDTKIVLGSMAGQTAQHCTGCHTFTRPVPENISIDSTRKFLVANGSPESCFGCHEMRNKLKGFEPQRDRSHQGVCGSCHNPHKQTQPKQAFQSCASGGCHSDLAAKSRFHSDKSVHKTTNCGQCHQAHEWKTAGRECIDCHRGIFNAKPGKGALPAPKTGRSTDGDAAPTALLRPASNRTSAQSFDQAPTSHRARRLSLGRRIGRTRIVVSAAVPARWLRAVRQQVKAAPPKQPATPAASRSSQQPKDSPEFSHKIHKVLACAGCHDQKNAPGQLRIRTATDCASCHHSAERSVSCEGCHDPRTRLTKAFPRSVLMHTNAGGAPVTRTLTFAHQKHRDLDCKGCHTQGILLGVTRDCQSCHTDHHAVERACVSCHAPTKAVHQRAAHDGCAGAGCHTNATVLALPPSRNVCVACHAAQVNHKPKRECAECHAVSWVRAVSPPR